MLMNDASNKSSYLQISNPDYENTIIQLEKIG